MPKRELMEQVLVRWGGQDRERLQSKDDLTLSQLVQRLKWRMVVPENATELQVVHLEE